MKTLFITWNTKKFLEAQAILWVELEQFDIDLTEIQELDRTIIIRHKIQQALDYLAQTGQDISQIQLFVEDTALEFDVMNGFPGPLIKRCLSSIGVDGLPQLLSSYDNKWATAHCTIAYRDGSEIEICSGTVHGQIVAPRADENSFGRDPVFLPDGYNQTFQEMPKSLKNTISHRYLALTRLQQILKIHK